MPDDHVLNQMSFAAFAICLGVSYLFPKRQASDSTYVFVLDILILIIGCGAIGVFTEMLMEYLLDAV